MRGVATAPLQRERLSPVTAEQTECLSVEFADVTIEVCDGVPSFVEDGTLEGDRYCPWAAQVIDIEPAN